jgi:hypothetical protein
MAVQRINFLEANFEKILVGLAGAGLLGVIAWQVTDRPTVMVDKKPVSLDRAIPELEQMANRVKADIVAKEPKLPEIPATDIKAEFARKRSEPLVPKAPALAWNLPGLTGIKAGDNPVALARGTHVRIPNPPAPAKPVAGTFMSTIDPQEIANVPGLAALVPAAGGGGANGPFDKASVTIETIFNGVALREEFARVENAANPEEQLKPVPRGWWAGTEIVSVEVGRQRLLADGTWGEDTIVTPMPGRANLSEMIKRNDLDIAEVIRNAKEQREEILRPQFYQRASVSGHLIGEEWYPPSQAEAIEAKGDLAKQKQRELNELQKKATGLERVIAGLRQPANNPRPNPGAGRGAPAPGRGNPGGGPAPTPQQDELRRREAELAAVRAQIATKDAELKALGVRTGVRAPLPEDPQFKDLTETLRDPAIQIWAHDLDAKRGAAYRYRVRIGVSNPLFGQQRELKQQDAEISRRYAIFTAVSDWSEPVVVDPDVYYFITGASGKTNLTPVPNASAEMFMFSAGYWRRARVAMEPGDPLAGRVITLDWAKVAAAPAAPAPGAPVPPVGPAGPGAPRVAPPPVAPAPGRNPGAAPNAPGNAPAEKVEPLATQEVLVSKDVYLLDVPFSPESTRGVGGAATRPLQVFLRDLDGRIVVRAPGGERNSPAYQRLDQSATAGEAFTKNPTGGTAAPVEPRRPPEAPPPMPMPVIPGGGAG